MRFASLGSGSKGNATVIESHKTRVLIDCGFNRKHTRLRLQELALDLKDLDAILVSHEHGDHAKGVVLVCESIKKPFYATYGTARSAGWLDHPMYLKLAIFLFKLLWYRMTLKSLFNLLCRIRLSRLEYYPTLAL